MRLRWRREMLETRAGEVISCQALDSGTLLLDVQVEDARHRALAYRSLTGDVREGDRVLINTTAGTLGLGTGGFDFVVANLSRPSGVAGAGPGHIIKLRYTPHQFSVLADEEAQPELYSQASDIGGMPVVAAFLHSQVALVAAAVKAARPEARVAYVMTDGAALPIGVSNLVRGLLAEGLLDETITCGQAFGGMRETVNIYSALICARHASRADVAIVCQGPGNVGTGTPLGYSGVEAGQVINAAHSLGGRPVCAVRMSRADPRRRHTLISHHTLTALSRIALAAALVPLPWMEPDDEAEAIRQLDELKLFERHEIRSFDGRPGITLLEKSGLDVSSMGRRFADDPLFFLAGCAAGAAAAAMLDDGFAG